MSSGPKQPPTGKRLGILALGALGVVYGDIGTSPLYAFEECFFGPHRFAVTTDNVLGILSLIFWSLNFVVTFKYLSMVMRADNRGEGGILALLALVPFVSAFLLRLINLWRIRLMTRHAVFSYAPATLVFASLVRLSR